LFLVKVAGDATPVRIRAGAVPIRLLFLDLLLDDTGG
jgi:hypothetical protein